CSIVRESDAPKATNADLPPSSIETEKKLERATVTIATITVNGTPGFTKSPKRYGPGPIDQRVYWRGDRGHESGGCAQRDEHRERIGRGSKVVGDGQRHRRHLFGRCRIGDEQAWHSGDNEQRRQY